MCDLPNFLPSTCLLGSLRPNLNTHPSQTSPRPIPNPEHPAGATPRPLYSVHNAHFAILELLEPFADSCTPIFALVQILVKNPFTMATTYSKKTNSDLIEMLKARGLPHTGKKADMVARLVEADKAEAEKASLAPVPATAPAPAAQSAKADAADDVIDWDDDTTPIEPVSAQPTTSAANAATAANGDDAETTAAGGKGAATSATAVPNQKVDIDPSTTHDLTVTKPEEKKADQKEVAAETEADKGGAQETAAGEQDEAEKKAAENYSMGLATTNLDAELEKRRKRAEKFGIADDSSTKEAQKAMERAKRFGTANDASSGVKGLDEALPERSRKRGRGDDGDGYHRGGKRRNFSGRGRGRGGFDGRRRQNGGSNTGKASTLSEQDRVAMERRKARFG
ncbi:hypothetical protein CISG_07100 [Coccidioides immitis RMSCC 3703]|uniref:SAP domain-containing protein n=1 Tax=Coccidioides immitis RMSCC 3703 TaxID=454286 RepID=A0A0J8R3T3_COCIT|nr:hypothetical protein CISG_07100 [Coccidioides immitis RMSCC 3703]